MKEKWKDIPSYEGHYQVSNLGRIKSLEKVIINVNGIKHKRKSRILKPYKDSKGYLCVDLRLDNKRFNARVHRMVGICFIKNPNKYPQINHINGIKTDNNVQNLEWCTNKQNCIHAHQNNLTNPARGVNHGSRVLEEHEVIEIFKEYHENGTYQYLIAKKYGISQGQVHNIVSKKHWGHLWEKELDE